MAVTDVSICSNALLRLGAKSIASFTEGDRGALCGNIYEFRRNWVLSIYPWKFTLDFQQLARDTTDPIARWSYRYTLPPTRIADGLEAVYNTDAAGATPITGYEIIGGFLYTEETEIFVVFQQDIDEDLWPKYFQDLMINVMKAELAMPVTDQSGMAEALQTQVFGTSNENQMGGMMGTAMARNAQDSPPVAIADLTLVTVRGT